MDPTPAAIVGSGMGKGMTQRLSEGGGKATRLPGLALTRKPCGGKLNLA